jgi:hypothetical protein
MVTVPPTEDVHDFMDARGWSDGLPLVPPTAARVRRMLGGCSRLPSERLPDVPPCGGVLTVEKVAISAVMAGCRPEQFAVALAAVEAMLDKRFNLHGVSATTMGATPVVVVSGPARLAAGLNFQAGVLGSGSRNVAIGRTLKLVLQNQGGAKLGGTESTTIGTPMKFGLCCAEHEELLGGPDGGGWEPLHTMGATGGHHATDSAVLVAACVSGPHLIVDPEMGLGGSAEENAAALCELLASALASAYAPPVAMINDVLLVISPEHYKTLRAGGVDSKEQLQERLWSLCNGHMAPHLRKLIAHHKGGGAAWHVAGGAVGLAARAANVVSGGGGLKLVPKFDTPRSIHIVVAGGGAGKFSAFMPCFGLTREGPMAYLSRPVSVKVQGMVAVPPPLEAAAEADGPLVALLDPAPTPIAPFELAPRAAGAEPSLLGTVGMLSISKRGSDPLLDRLAELLAERFPGTAVRRYTKQTFSRVAGAALLDQIAAECRHVVAALAD